MEQLWMKEQVESLRIEELIELKDIPNIDLYMDQLITLFEDKLSHTKRSETDKLLTKTMINNYTKDKVLMPAVKKKYTKNHIILMILLYQHKSIISIADIKELFSLIKNEEQINIEDLEEIYEAYLKMRAFETVTFKESIEKRVDVITKQMNEAKVEGGAIETILLVSSLIEQANFHKRLAEKIIDEWIKDKNK